MVATFILIINYITTFAGDFYADNSLSHLFFLIVHGSTSSSASLFSFFSRDLFAQETAKTPCHILRSKSPLNVEQKKKQQKMRKENYFAVRRAAGCKRDKGDFSLFLSLSLFFFFFLNDCRLGTTALTRAFLSP
ncbi:hypothetical protein PUN28_001264 [Cardiocondyla obscurior]|uniref:Uncharacterized protein n=1 Tax=Cardiocondyla obscurior TaxID=286306 RepID=A0AAW2H442_9HYME